MKKLLSVSVILLSLYGLESQAQQSWVQVNTGKVEGFNTVHVTSSFDLLIGTEQGNIYKSTNGGQTLSLTTTPTTDGVADIIFTSTSTAWAVGDDGLILKSLDTGNTWSQVTSGVSVNLESIHFADSDTAYIAGRSGTILRTTNGGNSWSSISSGTSNRLEASWFTTGSRGFIAGRDGTFLSTSNAGSTWSSISLGSDDNKSIYFHDLNTGFIAGENGIYKTINGGAIWNSTSFNGITEINSIHFGTPSTGYVVGEDGTIALTHDYGNTWNIDTVISSLAFTELNDVFMINAKSGVIVGDVGTLLVKLGTTGGGGGNKFCQANYEVDTVHSGGGDVYIINYSIPSSYNSAYTTNFFWDFGDGNTSTQSFPVHTYQNSGAYGVCVTITSVDSNSNTCVDTFCDTVGLDANGNLLYKTLGVGFTINVLDPSTIGQREYPFHDLEVYPNPVSESLKLKLPSTTGKAHLQVLGLNGHTIRTKEWYPGDLLNVANLPQGTYIIRLTDKKNSWQSTFVKH